MSPGVRKRREGTFLIGRYPVQPHPVHRAGCRSAGAGLCRERSRKGIRARTGSYPNQPEHPGSAIPSAPRLRDPTGPRARKNLVPHKKITGFRSRDHVPRLSGCLTFSRVEILFLSGKTAIPCAMTSFTTAHNVTRRFFPQDRTDNE